LIKKRGGTAKIENAFGWKRNSIIAASDRQRKLFSLSFELGTNSIYLPFDALIKSKRIQFASRSRGPAKGRKLPLICWLQANEKGYSKMRSTLGLLV
jgi:hypothetical protein